jgi:hypothetical protein
MDSANEKRGTNMGNEMTFVLWPGDPLGGVVTWGSAGLAMWSLAAALVGCLLGMLRTLDATPRRHPVPPRPRPRRPSSALPEHVLPALS